MGKDAAEHMLDELKEDTEKIFTNYIKKPRYIELTPEEQQHFNAATECHICGGKFTVDNKKVRDHCHILGDLRDAAHNICNMNFKIDPNRWKLPIFFHNLNIWAADLVEMQSFSRSNSGYKYILMIIDVFSKRLRKTR